MRKARELMAAPPMRDIIENEIAPGTHLQSDEELLEWVRNTAETTYHPIGTCKMGHDPMAVVDDRLRVAIFRALGIRVVEAENERAPPGKHGVGQGGPEVAEVQVACRRRREAKDGGLGHSGRL